MKKIILTALSYLFLGGMALGIQGEMLERATKQIEQHTEPKFIFKGTCRMSCYEHLS